METVEWAKVGQTKAYPEKPNIKQSRENNSYKNMNKENENKANVQSTTEPEKQKQEELLKRLL